MCQPSLLITALKCAGSSGNRCKGKQFSSLCLTQCRARLQRTAQTNARPQCALCKRDQILVRVPLSVFIWVSFIIMKLKGSVRFVRVQADTSLSAWPQMEVYLNRSIWPVFLPEVKLVMNVLSIRNAGLRTLKSRADALKPRELLTLNRLDRRSPARNIFTGFFPTCYRQ